MESAIAATQPASSQYSWITVTSISGALGRHASTTSWIEAVVVVEYCGYSGNTTMRLMPRARRASSVLRRAGSP